MTKKPRPLTEGQKWLLEIAYTRYQKGRLTMKTPLGFAQNLNTNLCPAPVGMSAVRGLIGRGLLIEKGVGLFYMTEEGVRYYEANLFKGYKGVR